MQRREEARNRRGGGILFPGGDGREEAMARRSKTIPKEEPKKGKVPEYYIGEQGVKRKRESGKFDLEERGRRRRPNPAPGNQKLTAKAKVERVLESGLGLKPRRNSRASSRQCLLAAFLFRGAVLRWNAASHSSAD